MKRRYLIALLCVLLAVPAYYGVVKVQSQSLATVRTILHDVWDRANHTLMGSAWSGPSAQDVMETETTIANDIWDPTTHSIRVAGGTDAQPLVLTEMPAEPCVLHHTFILESTQEHFTCTTDLIYQPVKGADTSVAIEIPGLITEVDAGILSQHWVITPMTGTQALGSGNGMIAVTVGTLGTTLTLPDPTLSDTPTTIIMYIVDSGTGFLTVLPFATETIGDYGNTSPPPITGKGSKYEFTLLAGNWHLVTTTTLKLGQLGGQTLCVGVGGSVDSDSVNVNTDFDHTITCNIPTTLALKTGDVIQACTSYEMTTGAASPEITAGLKIGSVKVSETGDGQPGTNFANRSMHLCWIIVLQSDFGAATPTWTAPIGILTAVDTNGDANGIAQPINIDFTADRVITFYTNLSIDASGTNTVTQEAAWITVFRK